MAQEHSSKQYDLDLETLRSRVLEMGGLVESQILSAINGLATGDTSTLDKVIQEDTRVNALEVSIDTDCSHLIARRQPTAGDLRMVLAVIKIIVDLERIGDEAAKIARMGKRSSEHMRLPRTPIAAVRHMGEIGIGMLRKALDALARLDPVAAAAIVREDVEIDEEFRSIVRQLITFMMEDPRTISQSIDILWVAKAIERIGDHSKNMAEQVIYVVKGTDVRHTTVEQLEREALG